MYSSCNFTVFFVGGILSDVCELFVEVGGYVLSGGLMFIVKGYCSVCVVWLIFSRERIYGVPESSGICFAVPCFFKFSFPHVGFIC